MKKKKVFLVSLLMAVALVGLIVLQLTWIRHDFILREEKFGQLVTNAITDAIAKIETRESVHLIARNANNAFLEDSIRKYFTEYMLPPMTHPVTFMEPVNPDSLSIPGEENFTFISDFDSTDNGRVTMVTHHTHEGHKVSVSVNSSQDEVSTTFTTVEAEEQIRQAEAVNKQAYEFAIKARKRAKKNQELINQAQVTLAQEKVKQKVKRLNKVFEKMAVEYDRRSFNLLERINPATVDSMIGVELTNHGIKLPYSIALKNGANDSIVWQRADTLVEHSSDKEYAALLFPGDITNRRDVVKISFTDTFRYFISSMWLMLLSSAIFTMVVMFTFAYTLFIIFRQKKLSDIKNDFINNMTHEFKTPIATIRLAVESISNPEVIKDPDKVKRYMGIIRDENDRMNSHVENILQIAQFDKRSFIQDASEIDVHSIISDAIDKMKLLTEQKGGQVTFSALATRTLIKGDPRFISMAILNLLDNAIKYNDKTPVIDVHTINRDGHIVISVTDNGIGMKPEMCEKVFEKFYRVPSGNLHNVKGFGLGLNYVKAIVTAHDGTVRAESQLGKGSCFEISLPVI